MHQLNADIAGIALWGGDRANDRSIRLLSAKIASERADVNGDLADYYRTFTNRLMPASNTNRFSNLLPMLSGCKALEFDCAYTTIMTELMQQSMDAAGMAIDYTGIPELRQQARVIVRTDSNEINALKTWQQTGVLPYPSQQHKRWL